VEPAKPSTFTPLLRRLFGNEQQRELDELRALYVRVSSRQDAFQETKLSIGRRIYAYIDNVPESARRPFMFALHDLLEAEHYLWTLPPFQPDRLSMKEFVELRNLLHHKEYFFANQEPLLELLHEGLVRSLAGVGMELPRMEEPTPFTIPLVYALPEPRLAVEQCFGTLQAYYERGLFKATADQLYQNVIAASGYPPHGRKPLVYPTASDLPLDALVETYLAGTPFRDLFMAPVPLKLTHEDRFSHMHVIGGSGSGKTTLIENLIRHDLASPDRPSIVLIDPHSDLVRKLVRSDLGIEDRVILIDPRDTEHPLALNPFAVNRERLAGYDAATREQVTAGVIQTFGYLWSGLTNLSLTGKQEVLFRYVTRLMLSLPEVEGRNATILDMLRLMSDPAPYAVAIERLPEIPRGFFLNDFASKSFEGTREQIRYRLQAIIENPTMARLFTAPETKLDFFTEMNRGGIILVDTAKDFLKEGSSIFGKLILSLILQAVLERAAIPQAERTPTFIMVDEAGSFFSTNIDDLLTEARKYKAGLLLAHQYLDQASSSLRASLAANSAIKFASGLSAQDAGAMARDMRTTAEFILAQPKLQFAAHIRNVTPSAVSIPVSPITSPPQLTEDQYARLIARNRARVAMAGIERAERATPPETSEDLSTEW